MKARTPVQLVIAIIWLLTLTKASAFYDPGVQRWINRDPVNESGGINLYGFVQNTPVAIVDIFGLADVSIYDQNDTGGKGLADAECFKAGAEKTGSIVIPVSSPEDAAKKLKDVKEKLEAKGEGITKLSIWDHGVPGFPELGKENLEPKSKAWKDIASTVDPKGTIDLWGCDLCAGRTAMAQMQRLADAAERTVTACDKATDFDYYSVFGNKFGITFKNPGERKVFTPNPTPTPSPTPTPAEPKP